MKVETEKHNTKQIFTHLELVYHKIKWKAKKTLKAKSITNNKDSHYFTIHQEKYHNLISTCQHSFKIYDLYTFPQKL